MANLWFAFAIVLTVLTDVALGQVVVKGCSKSWVRLTCGKDDDTITVTDVRFTNAEGIPLPCKNEIGPIDLNVPEDMKDLCQTKSHCPYYEGVCNGRSDCAFFLGPDDFDQPMQETSRVVIDFTCKMGKSRQGSVIACAIFTVVLTGLLIGFIVYIIYKYKESPSDFTKFDNDTVSTGSASLGRTSGAKFSADNGGFVELA